MLKTWISMYIWRVNITFSNLGIKRNFLYLGVKEKLENHVLSFLILKIKKKF